MARLADPVYGAAVADVFPATLLGHLSQLSIIHGGGFRFAFFTVLVGVLSFALVLAGGLILDACPCGYIRKPPDGMFEECPYFLRVGKC